MSTTIQQIAERFPKVVVFAEKASMRRLFADVLHAHLFPKDKKCTEKDKTTLGNRIVFFSSEGHIASISPTFIPKIQASHHFRIDTSSLDTLWECTNNPFKKGRLKTLKLLIKENPNAVFINATDAGREGQLIYFATMVLAYGKDYIHQDNKHYRLWLDSTDEKSVLNAFQQLQQNTKYDTLTRSAIYRQIFDYNAGMIASIYNSRKQKTLASVGRVQTPTLKIVVQRYQQVTQQTKPIDRYQAFLLTKNGLKIKLYTHSKDGLFDTKALCSSTLLQFLPKLRQEGIYAQLQPDTAKFETKQYFKKLLLYSLTDLQATLHKRRKLGVKEWMTHIQETYDKGYISYPRSDSKHLPHAMKDEVDTLLHTLVGEQKHLINEGKKYLFDDTKISDHYAIIPTLKVAEPSLKTESEYVQTIVEELVTRLIECFFPPLLQKITASATFLPQLPFQHLAIEQEKIIQPNGLFTGKAQTSTPSNISSIQELDMDSFGVDTITPKTLDHYTENGLIAQMRTHEMGTPATRDTGAIFEALYRSHYMEKDTKTGKILPTNKGIALIDQLNDTLFCDLSFTASLEKKLEKGEDIKPTQEQVLKSFFSKFSKEEILAYEQSYSTPPTLDQDL